MYTFNRPSFWLHFRYQHGARLAQSVEHQTFNLRVMGSSPISGDQVSYWNQLLKLSFYKVPKDNAFCRKKRTKNMQQNCFFVHLLFLSYETRKVQLK